jgi:predicted HTH transcriptional regulator
VEFKRAILWNRQLNSEDVNLRKDILKTVTAFLNSGGGSLFIGVEDDKKPWGIADDLQCCGGSEDQFHLRLRDMIANLIGKEFCHHITTSIVNDPEAPAQRVCAIGVTRANRAAFLKSGSDSTFYVRNDPQTVKLSTHDALVHIRNIGLQI